MSFTTTVGGIGCGKSSNRPRISHWSKTICSCSQTHYNRNIRRKIDEMLERKQSLNNAVITSDSRMTELSTDELKELLGV